MKSIRNSLWASLVVAGATLTAAAGFGLAAAADDATTAPPPPPGAPGPHAWHHERGPWHLLGKLGLSETQKQQIKDIMTAARPQMQNLREQVHANRLKLQQTQPSDPNYANIASQVSQTQGSLAAQVTAQKADLRAQVFKVLTPTQQAQLATLEAQMQAHRHGARGGPEDRSDTPPAQ